MTILIKKLKYKTYDNTPIAYYSCSIKQNQNSKSPNIAAFQKMQKENNFDKTEIIQYFDFSKNGKRK